MAGSGKWADQPFKLVPIPGQPGVPTSDNKGAEWIAADMANAHNGFVRSLNSIYLQCEHVHEEKDIADIVFYIKTWGELLHHHHHTEESELFPALEQLANEAGLEGMPMSENVQEHRHFDKALLQMTEYLAEIQAGTKIYDGKVVKAYIDDFGPVLVSHLHSEITTLLRLEVVDGPTLKKRFIESLMKIIKTADPHTVVPLGLGSFDTTCPGSEGFPNVPWILPYMCTYWYSRKHRGAWRFSPCDFHGKPQPLKFLGP